MRVATESSPFPTIAHAATYHAEQQPDAMAFELVLKEDQRTQLSYGELHQQAIRLADYLQKHHKKGDRVLLPSNNELSFHVAFLGCMYAGCIAVPVQIPRPKPNLPDMGLGRFISIIQDCNPTIALIDDIYVSLLEKYGDGIKFVFKDTPIKSIQQILTNHQPSDQRLRLPEADELAFLQYTSGSTSNPKGVMLTHANIVANQRSIDSCYQLQHDTTIITWLPTYHDMGLCSGFFMPVYKGCPAIIMQPLAFIAKPVNWLQEISRHKSVVSGGPNFAFSHCIDRVPDSELERLDLSEWKLAFCGAEPIRPETIKGFSEKFSQAGFNLATFCPSYGLAEATLYVSAKNADEKPLINDFCADSISNHSVIPLDQSKSEKAVSLVSCGRPGKSVQIVDPDTLTPLPNGKIGEIAVASNSNGSGYWNNPEASTQTFNVKLKGIEDQAFMLTGDFGFIHEQELYVSGRIKEIIIINGVNHYPQDIEYTAQQQHNAFNNYKAAAFSLNNDNNQVILILEAQAQFQANEAEQLIHKIKQSVRLEHQILISEVLLVSPGSIPRTSSGKVQRTLCAKLYRKQHFQTIALTREAS